MIYRVAKALLVLASAGITGCGLLGGPTVTLVMPEVCCRRLTDPSRGRLLPSQSPDSRFPSTSRARRILLRPHPPIAKDVSGSPSRPLSQGQIGMRSPFGTGTS